jgi:MtN3 and saliva related transmembrane protein
MSETWITAVGVLAGALTAGSWLPQVAKTLRTRSARDFSWGYLTFFTLGVAMWLTYGLLTSDLAVIWANVVTLALLLIVIVVKARDRKA